MFSAARYRRVYSSFLELFVFRIWSFKIDRGRASEKITVNYYVQVVVAGRRGLNVLRLCSLPERREIKSTACLISGGDNWEVLTECKILT
jgi:hypothetical protein